MTTIHHARDLFLLCMSAIYLIAFASLYAQVPGLYGNNGVLPARLVVGKEAKSWDDLMEGMPTLLKLTPKLGLDTATAMDLLCLMGMSISFVCILWKPMRDTVSFILLWMFYLSLYQVGQTFLWFQWDILLLETGFLTILVAPVNIWLPFKKLRPASHHQHDTITMWLVKWLLFRLMFASGVVKLTSRCPTWWGLTALSWHFESQCIPTPLAWYWHHLPVWFLKLSTVATYVIEIVIPFLFFSPVRSMRIFAFWAQIFLQLLIIVTGNYNFFNLLTITLCIALLDDAALSRSTKRRSSGAVLDFIACVVIYGYIAVQTWKYFSLRVTPDFTVESKIAFKEKEFFKAVEVVMPYTIGFAAFSLAFEILVALVRCFQDEQSFIWKNWAAVQCLIFGAIAAGMFSISLVPHTVLDGESQKLVPEFGRVWNEKLYKFQITSSYGLFRSMTGVGGRPEVIIEGSNDRDKGWKEYEFLYKPGDVSRRPPIVAPHQPRLDWQMWFAALGNYNHNPWFLNLVYRLLTGEKDVLELIDKNPFPNKPPKYIRARQYLYHYTTNKSTKHGHPTGWWMREEVGEYLPALSKNDPGLVDYLKKSKLIDPKYKPKASENFLNWFIAWIRNLIGQPEGFMFVMSLLAAAATIHFITVRYVH